MSVLDKKSTTSTTKNNSFWKAASNHYYGLLLIVLAGIYVLVQVLLIPVLPLSFDEGTNLQVSSLIRRGYEPYSQIFTMGSPLFVWLIGWLGQLDLSPAGVKSFFLLFGLLLLINTALIARAIFGNIVSLTAAFLLAVSTSFLFEAAGVLAVTPSLSIATLSLVFALRYVVSGRKAWLILSGLVWGLALQMSVAALATGLALLLFLISLDVDRAGSIVVALNWRDIVSSKIGLWLVGAIVSLGIGLVIATPDIVFGHVLANSMTVRENLPILLGENFSLLGRFLAFNLWLFVFAGYSLVRIYDQPDHPLWLIFGWAIVGTGWLVLQTTLRLEDAATNLPPLAIMAGWGLVELIRQFSVWSRARPAGKQSRWILWAAVCLGSLLLFAWVSWQQIKTFSLRDIDTPGRLVQLQQRQEVVDFIQQHTAFDDCVIIDDTALAVAANRLPAPELVSLTRERLQGGLISAAALERLVREHNCTAVVFSKREYTQPLSGFRSWVETYYPNQQEFTRTKIYYQ